MKMTSKELERRFKKARSPIVVEISGGNMTVQSRAAHFQTFMADAKRLANNNRRGLLMIAIQE